MPDVEFADVLGEEEEEEEVGEEDKDWSEGTADPAGSICAIAQGWRAGLYYSDRGGPTSPTLTRRASDQRPALHQHSLQQQFTSPLLRSSLCQVSLGRGTEVGGGGGGGLHRQIGRAHV